MSIKEHITGIFAGAAANDETFVKVEPQLNVPVDVIGHVLTPAGQHLIETEERNAVYASDCASYLHDLLVESTCSSEGVDLARNKVLGALQSIEEKLVLSEENGADAISVFAEAGDLYTNRAVFENSSNYFNSIGALDVAQMVESVAQNIEAAQVHNWLATPSYAPQTVAGYDQDAVANDDNYTLSA